MKSAPTRPHFRLSAADRIPGAFSNEAEISGRSSPGTFKRCSIAEATCFEIETPFDANEASIRDLAVNLLTLTSDNAIEVDRALVDNRRLGVIVPSGAVINPVYLARLQREGRPVLTEWIEPVSDRRGPNLLVSLSALIVLLAAYFAVILSPILDAVLPSPANLRISETVVRSTPRPSNAGFAVYNIKFAIVIADSDQPEPENFDV